MNTFGLKKKGQSPFWLKGGFSGIIVQLWKKTVEFTVYLTRQINLKVQR